MAKQFTQSRAMHASEVARHLLCGSLWVGCCSHDFCFWQNHLWTEPRKKRLSEVVLMIETYLPSFILPTTSSTYSSMLTCHDGGNTTMEYFLRRKRYRKQWRKLPTLLEWTCLFWWSTYRSHAWQAKHCQIYINMHSGRYGIISSIFSKNIAVYYLS